MHRDGQRVTDAALIPVILNTYGAIGEKAVEFLHAVAGKEAKRIIDEISMLAVLLSADMILMSHAPSNLPNLFRQSPPLHPNHLKSQRRNERVGGMIDEPSEFGAPVFP